MNILRSPTKQETDFLLYPLVYKQVVKLETHVYHQLIRQVIKTTGFRNPFQKLGNYKPGVSWLHDGMCNMTTVTESPTVFR